MAKGFSSPKGFTARPAGVSPRIASVPGSGSKTRINQAAGQHTKSASGAVIGKSSNQSGSKVPVASGSDMVMPTAHPGAKTTRITKGGTI